MASKPETLAGIINQLNQTHGPGTVVRGSELNWEKVPRMPSGSFALDTILGGGWPINRWAEIYGDFSCGKTTLILKTIAANQQSDPAWTVWWLAAEEFDTELARMCGVDLSRVHLHETNVMQEGLQRVIDVAETREVDCIVIDSYPALVPAEEDDADMGDWAVGLGARLNGQFWRKQGPAVRRSLVEEERPLIGFVVNQPREKIGVTWGNPETTPGGRGKNFYYSIRLQLRRGDWIEIGTKEHKEKVGQEITATAVKNKSSRPYRTAVWDFFFADVADPETGEVLHEAGSYDTLKELVDVALAYGVIPPPGGGIYRYGDVAHKGRAAIYAALGDASLRDRLYADVMTHIHGSVPEAPKKSAPKTASPVKTLPKKRVAARRG